MTVLVPEDDFEFVLVTFHWWQPSTTSLMIVPIFIFIISTLEIALANIHRDVIVLVHTWDCSREHSAGCTPIFGGGGCPLMQQSGLSLPFVFVCLLYDLLSFLFPFSPINLESTLLLWDRSPDSSEPFVTLDSRSSLIRTTFGVHTSFFPGSHLRVSRTSPEF